MSFNAYENLAQVLQDYQIQETKTDFIEVQEFAVRPSFKEDLEFSLREFSFEGSEYGVCETLIFPVLKEVYRYHHDHLTLWSHKPLNYDAKLCGVPDYIVASRSPLGKSVFDTPYFVAIEAKRDDFIKGWGQCLAEMVAIQKANQWGDNHTVFGIVSNGSMWEFGRLTGTQFEQNFRGYGIYELEILLGAINYIFKACVI
ncbi:MAG: hypothetical protein ACFCA4_18110 [Cyanophyceae cyanobacterium]